MRILFIGSDQLACASLSRLQQSRHEVVAVVTQPDRPVGRKLKVLPCALKQHARDLGCRVLSPEKIGDPDVVDELRTLQPDLMAVVAYGQYIPQHILQLAPEKGINLHPSLLPLYRGASPIQWTLIDGCEETGVTILYVSEEMDAGDILLQKKTPVQPDDNAISLAERLSVMGADMLLEAIDLIDSGEARPFPQDHDRAVTVRKIDKQLGHLNWRRSAVDLHNLVRGLIHWPVCYSILPDDTRLQILETEVEEGRAAPGEIVSLDRLGPLVGTGEQLLRLKRVRPAGRKATSGGDFVNGCRLQVGDRFQEH